MRILIHDYCGHPFQAELSSELSHRHQVVHSWCEAQLSGKGNLGPSTASLTFDGIGRGEKVDRMSFGRRLLQEWRFAGQLIKQVRRHRPDVVMMANVPVPMLVVVAAYLRIARRPWVLWHQDVQGIAIKSFAGTKLSRAFTVVAWLVGRGERWAARRAAAIVVISDAFLAVHREWGTLAKTTVIPNWAPLDEIKPVPRHNAWSAAHGLDGAPTLLYSGTLGLKHNPALLVELAAAVRTAGVDAHLVVVTEGPAVPLLEQEADRLHVPMTLLPFQPYERLSEVLGSGDILVVLLEATAGAFSVPSKTLSYLAAGRPILGLMPPDNPAAQLVDRAGGLVLPPDCRPLTGAGTWGAQLLADADELVSLGGQSRDLAESAFSLNRSASSFDRLLSLAVLRSDGH